MHKIKQQRPFEASPLVNKMENVAGSSLSLSDIFVSAVNSVLYYCSIILNIITPDKLLIHEDGKN